MGRRAATRSNLKALLLPCSSKHLCAPCIPLQLALSSYRATQHELGSVNANTHGSASDPMFGEHA